MVSWRTPLRNAFTEDSSLGAALDRSPGPGLRLGPFAAALFLAVLAQYLFTGEALTRNRLSVTTTWKPRFTVGCVLLGVATALAAFSAWRRDGVSSAETPLPRVAREEPASARVLSDATTWAPRLPWAAGLLTVVAIGIFLVAGENALVRGIWLLSIGLMAGPFLVRARGRLVPEGISRREWALVGGLTALGFWLRYYRLTELPAHVDNDVALMGFHALDALEKGETRWIGLGPTDHLFSSEQLLALGMRLFGRDHQGLVTPSVLAGTVTLPLVFLIGRLLFGRAAGLFAMALLTASYTHIHFSRILFGPIATMFLALMFYFLTRAQKERDPAWFALAGTSMGLGLLTYYSSRIGPVLVVTVFAAACVTGWRVVRSNLSRWALLFLAGFVTFGPMAGFALKDPERFVGRGNDVAIWSEGVLRHSLDKYAADSIPEMVVHQVGRTLLALHLYGDESPHFALQKPMVSAPTAALFVLGVGILLVRLRRIPDLALLAWVALTFVFGGILTADPPYSPHLNIALPAIALIAGLAASRALAGLATVVPYGRLLVPAGVAASLGWLALHNWEVYVDFAEDNADPRIRASRFLATLPEGTRVHFQSRVHDHDAYAFRFFNRETTIYKLEPEGAEAVEVRPGHPTVFLLYEPAESLPALQRRFPEGVRREHRDADGTLIFVSYSLNLEGQPARPERAGPSRRGWWLLGGALFLAIPLFFRWRTALRSGDPDLERA